MLSAVARSARPTLQAVRHLNLHEYQSKELMDKYGVNTQKFRVADTPDAAERAARDLNVNEIVFKAQIHAGGRGKGTLSSGLKGGVHLTKDPKRVRELAEKTLGYRLVTKQTSAEGVEVKKVMVAEALDIARETYFAILMDRASGGPVLVGSPQGGMDIEAVAEATPHLIFKEPVNINKGIQRETTLRMAHNLGFKGEKATVAAEQMERLYKLFLAVDATQVEINPFGETPQGQASHLGRRSCIAGSRCIIRGLDRGEHIVVCFDAKINFDDNASFRQQEIFDQRDTAEEDPREVAAAKFNLNYIGMDGEIGCLVNGAGLAMATMDIIKLYGGTPANFLDVGGSATEKAVKEAFKIITTDKQVKGILVNIFGGIMKCDTIALGILGAAREIGLKLPLVVRLAGTNVDLAKRILAEQKGDIAIINADDLDDAAQKAVAAIRR